MRLHAQPSKRGVRRMRELLVAETRLASGAMAVSEHTSLAPPQREHPAPGVDAHPPASMRRRGHGARRVCRAAHSCLDACHNAIPACAPNASPQHLSLALSFSLLFSRSLALSLSLSLFSSLARLLSLCRALSFSRCVWQRLPCSLRASWPSVSDTTPHDTLPKRLTILYLNPKPLMAFSK